MLLWQGFSANRWNVAEPQWFEKFQLDSESFVIGRLVQAQQAGPFSYGAFPGWGSSNLDPLYNGVWFQYYAYFGGPSFSGFEPYQSQPGGQAQIFVALDALLTAPAAERYQLYRDLTALLSAAALSLVILWFGLEHGVAVGLAVLVSALASEWLTVFGRNLWWSLWSFYAPLVVSLYWLRRHAARPSGSPAAFGGVVFAAVAAKGLLTGYEYFTTLVVMVLVPVVYYGLRHRWGRRRTLTWLAAGAAGSGLAALALGAVLTLQIASVRGSLQAGIEHIWTSFAKRTYGDPEAFSELYRGSLEAPVHEVLLTYLRGRYFDFNRYLQAPSLFVTLYLFKIRYLYLMLLFLAASAMAWRQGGVRDRSSSVGRQALIIATWSSLLAPLSWLVLFKAHSEIHTHMNFITWQMPFTLFGFAVVATAAGDLMRRLRRAGRAAPAGVESEAGDGSGGEADSIR